LKQWKCVQVLNHIKVGEVIEENQKDGWYLHTYNTAVCSQYTGNSKSIGGIIIGSKSIGYDRKVAMKA